MLKDIYVIILAGGLSSRLWPFEDKSLIKFNGQPLLAIQLNDYISAGFRKFAIIVNKENKEQINAILSDFPSDIWFHLYVQEEAKGMGNAILQVEPLVHNPPSNVPVYITQVHDVFNSNLHLQMASAFAENSARSYLAGIETEDYFPGGYLIVDADRKIEGIVEKPGKGNEPSKLVNIVAHMHPDLGKLIAAIKAEYDSGVDSDDHYERALAKLMQGYEFQAIPYSEYWFPIKYPWHVLDLMHHHLESLSDYRGKNVKIEDGVNIVGPVHIEDDVRIFSNADIRGPVYIGKGTIIGQYASIRNSMVASNCVIGLRSEVNRSYIGQGTDMHSSLALDSITVDNPEGSRTNLSAGMITANFRMDHGEIKSNVKGEPVATSRTKFGAVIGPGAFIGINASLAPGIKIGRDCQIGMNTVVMEDIPDNTRYYFDQPGGKIKQRTRYRADG
jgi:bifunctional UDP-N-acetylglucosamine pyrophosphorylase/glucosamine-1-phosphate N-acetyltransferase